jgi:phospholipid/cholesterol/gamma-HCH transport system substrate-binding protein
MNDEANQAESSKEIPPVIRLGARREVWVGVFTLVGVLAILVALFTFTQPSTFRQRYTISTVVADAAGLRRNDPVQYRGVNIGRIKGFDLSPDGVVVKLELERRYHVPRDSRVELSSGALLGGSVAQIIPGESTEPAPHGAVLPGSTTAGLSGAVGQVAEQSEKTLHRVDELLSDRTIGGIEGSVEQLQVLLGELSQMVASQRSDVEQLTKSLRATATNTQKLTSAPEVERSVKRLDSITQRLDEATASFDRASQSMEIVLGRIQRGEGTLGRLSKDDTLYQNANQALVNLNRTTTEMRALATDVRANPHRYVHISVF